jgi:hypothetical protein
MVPPLAPTLPPSGLMAHAMPLHYLYGTLPTIIVFTKQKLKPPRGAQTGAAASILKGVWGQFAPIITSNDFYRAKKMSPLFCGFFPEECLAEPVDEPFL